MGRPWRTKARPRPRSFVEYSEPAGKVRQTGQLEYKLVDGAWVPSATVFRRFVEQNQQTYYEKRATFQEVRINEFVSPLTFNITKLGLTDGDVFFDRVSSKQYVYRDGQLVGYLNSGGYGHTLGGAVGLGSVENEGGVTADFVKSGSYELEVAGVRYPARASLRPLYDPRGERIRS